MHSGWAVVCPRGVLPAEPCTLSRERLARGGQSHRGRGGDGGWPRCQRVRITDNKTGLKKARPLLPSRCVCRLCGWG